MVRLLNAKGPNARRIDGIYEPIEEQRDGLPVYKKKGDSDTWLEYWGSKWIVHTTEYRGTDTGFAYVSVDRPCLPHDDTIIGSWQLFMNGAYEAAPQLLVTLLSAVPQHVADLLQRAQLAHDREVDILHMLLIIHADMNLISLQRCIAPLHLAR